MIPALDDRGRLIPPSSKTAAVARIQQLEHECRKIQTQLAQPARVQDLSEHLDWRNRATRKLGQLRSEQSQLHGFVAGWDASTQIADELFKKAYELLQLLELEIDFDETENAVMDSLDTYFNKEKVHAQG